MGGMKVITRIGALAAVLLGLFACWPAMAAEEDYFRGKSMSLIIPIGPGGAYDAYGRLVAKHFTRFLPGNPTIVPRNMPGGGGAVASNYIYNVAPKDGTTLTIITSSFVTDQILHHAEINYDARKFSPLGRLQGTRTVLFFWHTAPIRTAKDLWTTESTIANSTLNELPAARLMLMNSMLGTKMKLIPGYPSAKDFVLASERGEADGGATTYVGLMQLFSDYVTQKKLNIVMQFGATRDRNLPDVPALFEFTDDPEARQVFNFMVSNDEVGRSLYSTPGIPAARLATMRAICQKMLADNEFKADAQRLNLEIDPKTGEELQQIVDSIFDTSPQAIAKIRETITR
jgi:tripartite-type tricarboxylate transporter receptor subunit TctC